MGLWIDHLKIIEAILGDEKDRGEDPDGEPPASGEGRGASGAPA